MATGEADVASPGPARPLPHACRDRERLVAAAPLVAQTTALGGIVGFLAAGYTAASRLADNKHWASDVVFGAVLGIDERPNGGNPRPCDETGVRAGRRAGRRGGAGQGVTVNHCSCGTYSPNTSTSGWLQRGSGRNNRHVRLALRGARDAGARASAGAGAGHARRAAGPGAGAEINRAAPLRPEQGRSLHRLRGKYPDAGLQFHPFFQSAYSGGGFTLGAGYRRLRRRVQHARRARQLHAERLQADRGGVLAPRLFDRRGVAVGHRRLARSDAGRLLRPRHATASKEHRANYGFKQPYGIAMLDRAADRGACSCFAPASKPPKWEQTPGSGSVRRSKRSTRRKR